MEHGSTPVSGPRGAVNAPAVRWYNSLIFRVILLCVVQIGCLFAAVYVIVRHYTEEIVTEMEAQTQDVMDSMEVILRAAPSADLDDLERRIKSEGLDIELGSIGETRIPTQVTFERDEAGRLFKVARTTMPIEGEWILLTVRVAFDPQTEIIRAFSHRQMSLITGVFLVALGLLIYFIAKMLRPITQLSVICAKISRGELEDVPIGRNSGEVLALESTFNTMVASLREKDLVEAKLRQAQRLSALGSLAAGIAHDVRNPLNAIKLLSSHALDAIGEGPGNKQLTTIRAEVDRLDDIVSGFLSLAKEREIQPEMCRVDGLLEDCVRLIRKDAEARGVHLITEFRTGDTELLLDPKQFSRAMLNVLLNALEACRRDGRVRLFSRISAEHCAIEVRDDGPGLSREHIERAFDPYFTTKPTGTGLGLSITRGIIEEHGGTIELSSAEGQGCQVLILFPLRKTIA